MLSFEFAKDHYFEQLKLLRYAERTRYERGLLLKDFFLYLEKQLIFDLTKLRSTHLQEYQKYRSQVTNKYHHKDRLEVQNRYLNTVKHFLEYLYQEGYLSNNPGQELRSIKVPKRLPKSVLTFDEMKMLFKVIPVGTPVGYRDRTIFEMLYSSALRRAELCTLQMEGLDYREGYARVIGKGDKERVVPIGKIACGYLENYIKGVRPLWSRLQNSEAVFLGVTGQPLKPGTISFLARKYAKKSNLDKHVTSHTFRRSAVTGMIRNKANIMLLRQMLGHDSMEAIAPYINLTITDLKETHQKTHPREKKK